MSKDKLCTKSNSTEILSTYCFLSLWVGLPFTMKPSSSLPTFDFLSMWAALPFTVLFVAHQLYLVFLGCELLFLSLCTSFYSLYLFFLGCELLFLSLCTHLHLVYQYVSFSSFHSTLFFWPIIFIWFLSLWVALLFIVQSSGNPLLVFSFRCLWVDLLFNCEVFW